PGHRFGVGRCGLALHRWAVAARLPRARRSLRLRLLRAGRHLRHGVRAGPLCSIHGLDGGSGGWIARDGHPGGQQPSRPEDRRARRQEHAGGEARRARDARAVCDPGTCAVRARHPAGYPLAAARLARFAPGAAHRAHPGRSCPEPRPRRDGARADPLFAAAGRGIVAMMPARALLSADAVPELAREAQRAVAEGFLTLKLKVGMDDDYARAAVVRDAAGPDVKLRLDANGAWDAPEALRKLRELAPLRIELCEQPTPDLLGLEGSQVALAADEMVASDPEGALARAAVIVLKPMLLGGILPALRLARRAHERGRKIVVTSSLESAVGRGGAAHLAAAVLAFGPQPAAGIATGTLVEEDIRPDPFAPAGGIVRIPALPGLGLP